MGVLTMSESPGLPPEAFSKGLFRLGFNAMGTRCEILYAASSVEHADPFRRDALAWVRRFEARYTRFREDSLIGRINAAAGKDAVEIDEEDGRLFDLCETLHFHTEGLFDKEMASRLSTFNSLLYVKPTWGCDDPERRTFTHCLREGFKRPATRLRLKLDPTNWAWVHTYASSDTKI